MPDNGKGQPPVWPPPNEKPNQPPVWPPAQPSGQPQVPQQPAPKAPPPSVQRPEPLPPLKFSPQPEPASARMEFPAPQFQQPPQTEIPASNQSGKAEEQTIEHVLLVIILAIAVVGSGVVSIMYPGWKNSAKKSRAATVAKSLANRPPPAAPMEMQIKNDAGVTAFKLDVRGDARFKNQVMKSLGMIWESDRPVFDELKQYVYVIRNAEKTDFAVESDIPSILISNSAAFKSATWCAGEIAHQMFHARQYYQEKQQQLAAKFPPPPGESPQGKVRANPLAVDYSDLNSIENFERQADLFQISVLKAVGAPVAEIRLIERRPALNYSATHDGR